MAQNTAGVLVESDLYYFFLDFIHQAEGTIEELPGNAVSDMKSVHTFVMETPGGTDYGD